MSKKYETPALLYVSCKTTCRLHHIYTKPFGLMVMTNETLETVVWNLIWRQVITIPTNCMWNLAYKSVITNMAIVRIFEVRSDKFKANSVCTSAIRSSHDEDDDDRVT